MSPGTPSRLLVAALALFGAVHLANTAGYAIVMGPDSFWYLRMAEEAAAGQPFAGLGGNRFPPGYSLLLAVPFSFGLASLRTVLVVNALCGAAAVALFGALLGRTRYRGIPALVALLLLTASIGLTSALEDAAADALFLACVAGALLLMRESVRPPWRIAAVVLLTLAACGVRTVGVCLVPALVLWLVPGRRALLAFANLLGLLLIVDVFLLRSEYVAEAIGFVDRKVSQLGVLGGLARIAYQSLSSWGSFALNLPSSWAAKIAPLPSVLGLFVLSAVIVWLVRGRRELVPLRAFGAAYTAALVLYPAYSPRYALPLIPLAALAVWDVAVAGRGRLVQAAAALWVVFFVAAGAGKNLKRLRETAGPPEASRAERYAVDRELLERLDARFRGRPASSDGRP
ncbi:MAG: hypothetical protein JNK60_14870 [Acidobacteria bacterium]|nr:hypothetical protein [Acidobacteriota bacterium]